VRLVPPEEAETFKFTFLSISISIQTAYRTAGHIQSTAVWTLFFHYHHVARSQWWNVWYTAWSPCRLHDAAQSL